MSETQREKNGKAKKPNQSSGKAEAPAADEFAERAQQLAGDAVSSSQGLFDHASQLVATLQQGHQELGKRMAEGSASRPYVAMGAAAGVGFVLGGGLTFALTRRLVMFGGRMAVSMAMRRIMENAGKLTA